MPLPTQYSMAVLGSQPQQEERQSLTSGLGQPGGILSGLGVQPGMPKLRNWLGERSAALMGFGLPLLLAQTRREAAQLSMQGLQSGQQTDAYRNKTKADERRRAQQEQALATVMASLEAQGKIPAGMGAALAANPELGTAIAAQAFKPPERQGMVNAGDGQLYDPNTKTWITAPDSGPGGGMFDGKSVEAQSLNGLVESGAITRDQALQLGAGKTVTGPNGEIIFLTPQGIFSSPQGGQQQPAASPAAPGQPTAPAQTSQAAPNIGPGQFQVQAPRPSADAINAASKAEAAYNVLSTELDNYENLIKENGVAVLPGTMQRQQYDAARRNIQLQMKELYNLGVLNGPDLALMESMLVDPRIESGSNPWNLQERAAANIKQLKEQLARIRDQAVRRADPNAPLAAPGNADEGWQDMGDGVRIREIP